MADPQARTEAMTWRVGTRISSSATLTSIRGRKLTRKHRKMDSIIRVSRMSSLFCWADWCPPVELEEGFDVPPSIVPVDEGSAAIGRLPPRPDLKNQ